MLRRSAALLSAFLMTLPVLSQDRLVVLYRTAQIPASADAILRYSAAHPQKHLGRLGISLVSVEPAVEDEAIARLRAQPEVAAVLHDRIVTGFAMPVRAVASPSQTVQRAAENEAIVPSAVLHTGPRMSYIGPLLADQSYRSVAGWAVRAAGGYGNNVPGGPAVGPWSTTMGAGVRLAVLDSGVDRQHPDLVANLTTNVSEIDQTALPSACDDSSPQDQQGHGTWAASLAAGALGGGQVAGVAPQATLLNIKVLQRMPADGGSTLLARCQAGQTGGLLSWVLAGINDAIALKADVISLSLGTLVDLNTGDGAGWKASFDRVAYAAEQAGAVLVAAAGNDGIDLSGGRYIELPAQARGVLAIVAATNPDCAENLAPNSVCISGPVTRPYYSNYGGTALNAVSAPGGSYPEGADNAASGWILGACSQGLPNTRDGLPSDGESLGCFGLGHAQYVQAMGTSASAPLVAGAAALLRAAHRNWSSAQIIDALRQTASPSVYMAEPAINLPAALTFAP